MYSSTGGYSLGRRIGVVPFAAKWGVGSGSMVMKREEDEMSVSFSMREEEQAEGAWAVRREGGRMREWGGDGG